MRIRIDLSHLRGAWRLPLLPLLLLSPLGALACGRHDGAARDTVAIDSSAMAHRSASVAPGDTARSAAGVTASTPAGTPAVPRPAPGATTRAVPASPATSTITSAGAIAPASPSSGSAAPASPVATGSAPVAGTVASTAAVPAAPASVAPTTAAPAAAAPAPAAPAARRDVPFGTGERLVYDVKFGPVKVGSGSMEVTGIEPVRGKDAWHTVFRIKGGTLFYKVDDRYESWMDVTSLSSLRHVQDIDEGSYERKSSFDFFPERGVFVEYGGKHGPKEQPTVATPLDDGSFLYFVRTIPLEVGKSYSFNDYFRPDRNPVVITVARKERVEVPAGTFDAIVIRPTIKAKGIFAEEGKAEIWLADDSSRVMLQMKSQLKFGSLNLYLRSWRKPGS